MSEPIATVTAFLSDLARRDLEAAEGWLAPGFELHIAGQRFDSLASFAAFSARRQKFSKKNLDYCDHCRDENDQDVVYARGTMEGEWLNGERFADVFWLDRFQLQAGLIQRLDIVSDMAEHRPPIG